MSKQQKTVNVLSSIEVPYGTDPDMKAGVLKLIEYVAAPEKVRWGVEGVCSDELSLTLMVDDSDFVVLSVELQRYDVVAHCIVPQCDVSAHAAVGMISAATHMMDSLAKACLANNQAPPPTLFQVDCIVSAAEAH